MLKDHHSALKKYGAMKNKRMAATVGNVEQVILHNCLCCCLSVTGCRKINETPEIAMFSNTL